MKSSNESLYLSFIQRNPILYDLLRLLHYLNDGLTDKVISMLVKLRSDYPEIDYFLKFMISHQFEKNFNTLSYYFTDIIKCMKKDCKDEIRLKIESLIDELN